MLSNHEFEDKHILILGLAKSGLSVAKLLLKAGAKIIVNDYTPLEENPEAKELVELGVQVITGHHPVDLLNEKFDMIVKNPGIPYSNVMVERAMALNIPVYTEIEIAAKFLEGTVVGITGSNGKTTTTTLTTLMLKEAFLKKRIFAAGNIGVPLSHLVQQSSENDIYVTELSSFQLKGVETFHPKIACIVNIFNAHLDYHGNREDYITSKLQITKNQTSSDYLVYNADYPELLQLIQKKTPKATLVPFSRKKTLKFGAFIKEGAIYFNEEYVLSLESIQVPGVQNIENVLAAVAIAKLLGADPTSIERAVASFHGVKHRTQFVKELNGRKFYNDSKATNIVATKTALRSFANQSIVLIAGGLDRGNSFDDLIADLNHVSGMVVYGETKEKLKNAAQQAGVPIIKEVERLPQAVLEAYSLSKFGDVILFSPACASWDQFKNFEIRGDTFIESVEKLE